MFLALIIFYEILMCFLELVLNFFKLLGLKKNFLRNQDVILS